MDTMVSTTGSNQRQASSAGQILRGADAIRPFSGSFSGRGASFSGILLALAAALLFSNAVTSASAATVTDRPVLFKFETGQETAQKIAFDYASEAVYTTEGDRFFFRPSSLKRFHPDGTPFPFPATGSNEFPKLSKAVMVTVDNSGGPTQGRFYLFENEEENTGKRRISAYNPDGSLVWKWAPDFGPADIAVDADGDLWLFDRGGDATAEYDTSANPPELLGTVATGPTLYGDLDADDSLYARYTSLKKFVDGSPVWDLNRGSQNADLSTDLLNSGGRVIMLHTDRISEVEPDGSIAGEYDKELFGGDGDAVFGTEARSVAYQPAIDRVYALVGRLSGVSEDAERADPTVFVLGPPETGTVADLTINPPANVSISSADLSGTVNPQGTTSEWYFEWKKPANNWVAAEASTPQALPADSDPHAVEFTVDSLRGGTTYDVRLVADNKTSGLKAYSDTQTLSTSTAPAPPVLTINPAGNIDEDSAEISGTIDPEGDTADWLVEISTDPSCASGFQKQPVQRLAPGADEPKNVAWDLTNLLPSERYCARISATNSADTAKSAVITFETEPVAFGNLEPIGVAPRLDTSARLNALVDPEGEDLTYHFEYSADGGSTWQALPELTEDRGLRSPIVISQEVSGLQPNTEYLFRAETENPVTSELSGVRSFRTRTTAAVTLPARGYEMVSSPNKGNQNVKWPGDKTDTDMSMGWEPFREDGNRVLWQTEGGAPGGANGTYNVFIADRTPSGWISKSAIPPASQQVGGGEKKYATVLRNDAFTEFTFAVARSVKFSNVIETDYVGLDDQQNQSFHQHFERNLIGRPIAATTDGTKMLMVDDGVNGQIVEFGPSGSQPPEIVSIMPDGTPSSCLVSSGNGFVGSPDSGTGFGASLQWRPGYERMDVSDASIVYFETRPNGDCAESTPLGLYVRDRDKGETILIDPGVKPLGGADQEPEIIRSTPDGQHAYFLTFSKLDADDENSTRDLYRWDLATQENTCLTCIVSDTGMLEDGDSQWFSTMMKVRISDDFSRFYFMSAKVLVSGKGEAGKPNLYVLENGELKFVAVGRISVESAQFDRSGNVMVFTADASPRLSSDRSAPICPQNVKHQATNCEQLYVYEADEESIECVSCAKHQITTWSGVGQGGRRLSGDGNTLVFGTRETLLPQTDINRRDDIYEWRNGALRLVSNGVTEFAENETLVPQVMGVTDDGGSIFYSAPEPGLTGYERDGFSSLYVARVGGGFERPNPPAHCSEESCQGPLVPAPVIPNSGSSAVNGNGNVASDRPPRKCGKGKVRRKGKCVRKKKKGQRHEQRRGSRNGGRGK